MSSKALPVLAGFAAAGALLVAALPGSAGTGQRGGTLRVVMTSDVPSLDPSLIFSVESGAIAYATCRPLLNFPDAPAPTGSRVVPDAAAGPPLVRDGGRTYVFRIRRGLRFSNGAPLTAANFAAALNRVLSPAMNAYYSYLLSEIVGAKEVLDGKTTTARGIVARGNTLRIRLLEPLPDLVSRLALPSFCPIPVGLPVDAAGVDFVPGSGPYFVESRARKQEIVLERNPHYRGGRPSNPDRIVITIRGTFDSNVRLVEKNGADLLPLGEQPREELRSLAERYGVNRSLLRAGDGPNNTGYLILNTSGPLFRGNPQLRRAVGYGADRLKLADTLGFAVVRPTDQLLPRGMPGFRDERLYPLHGPDLRTARRLAAGHLRGGKAVYYAFPDFGGLRTAQALRHQLKQIGLELEIEMFARAVFYRKITTRGEPWDIAFGGWVTDTPDPGDFVVRIYGGPSVTGEPYGIYSWFDNPDVNRRIEAASRLSGEARYRAFQRLDVDVLRRHAPIVPIGSALWPWLAGPKLGCLFNHPYYLIDLAALCVK